MSEMALKISGKRFEKFNQFTVALNYNAIGSIFSFYGLTINSDQKNLFLPLSYHDAQIYFGKELLLTGTVLNTSSSTENVNTLDNITGYTKTGVLEDSNIPLSVYPLQFDNLSIKEIAEKIIKPFGLKLVVDNSVLTEANKKYETSTAEPDQAIKDYLSKLAKERNIILTHNQYGNLVMTRLNADTFSVATYTEGMPSTRISLNVNGQGFHSNVTVMKQTSFDVDTTGEDTVINTSIPTLRTVVKKQTSGDNDDTSLTALNELLSEYRNIVLTIETDRWQWYDGKKVSIIKPNYIIDVISPSNFINKKTRFFVEKVVYNGDNNGVSAVLTCVLPGIYSGNIPNNIFV